jgi:hypothetical protein
VVHMMKMFFTVMLFLCRSETDCQPFLFDSE